MRLLPALRVGCVGLAVLAVAGCGNAEERAATETVRALSELNDELSSSGGTVRLADYAALADEPYASTAAVNRLVFRESGLRQSGRTLVEVDDASTAGGIGVVVACLHLDGVTVTSSDGAAGSADAPTGPSAAASGTAEQAETTAVPLRFSLTQRDGAWVITEAVPVEIEGCGDSGTTSETTTDTRGDDG